MQIPPKIPPLMLVFEQGCVDLPVDAHVTGSAPFAALSTKEKALSANRVGEHGTIAPLSADCGRSNSYPRCRRPRPSLPRAGRSIDGCLNAKWTCGVDVEHSCREILNEAIELLKSFGVPAEDYLARGNVVDAVIAYCKQLAIDVVVLGRDPQVSGGRWQFERQQAFLAERAKCCVLIASGESEDSDSAASG
jgi:hypothetical protein